jgi:malate dehydrogenase (oxaloacetate-decarboxylating)
MEEQASSTGNAVTLRVNLPQSPGALAKVTATIGKCKGNIGAIDIIRVQKDIMTRDITVFTENDEHVERIRQAIDKLDKYEVVHISDQTFLLHLGGKIEVKSKTPIHTRDQLSMAYTPGVARICTAIHKDPAKAWNLTIKRNCVAIVSDGTAVLGLGDIGPEAAMPVMEGKAMLFKDFGEVDAFPICLDTTDTEEIIKTVKYLAPTFGGINLEDIAAPRCFEIEARLKEELDIPVFHDDQHGTAVVLVAALINSLKLVKKEPKNLKVVVNGVGAAGTACAKMVMAMGVTNLIGCDRQGAIYDGREDMNSAKEELASITNPNNLKGSLSDVMQDADVFIGTSGPGTLKVEDIKVMGKDPIVFAMANPIPEIMPELAYPHVAIMATGRSDYPNQINNVLCFPGLFRGALDCQAHSINEGMKLAAAQAIADVIPEAELNDDYIIPSVFDKSVAPAVAKAVTEAAIQSGVARRFNQQGD